MTMNVVLLGDSVLDNKAYVQAHEPDVRTQLAMLLGDAHEVTLCASNRSTTVDVLDQLDTIPEGATHLVVTMGGDNLIDQLTYVDAPASTTKESLIIMSALSEQFRKLYNESLQSILKLGIPTIACTMHDPHFDDDTILAVSVVALQVFNDCIYQEASQAGIPLIELRSICNKEADFANSIELSAVGGQKLADVIERVLESHDFSIKRTQVYV
jgi:hypothetical protein